MLLSFIYTVPELNAMIEQLQQQIEALDDTLHQDEVGEIRLKLDFFIEHRAIVIESEYQAAMWHVRCLLARRALGLSEYVHMTGQN